MFGLWLKRHQVGKSSSLKAKIKEAETDLDVTSIMLAREQAKYQVYDLDVTSIMLAREHVKYQVYDHSPFKDRLKVKKIKILGPTILE